MASRNTHGQLIPGNIANQKYELNLQLQRYFNFVKTASPSKETTNWRALSPEKANANLIYAQRMMSAKRRHEAHIIARDNLRMFKRLDQIKSNGTRVKIDNQISSSRSLHLLNHLHGHQQKELIRQRKLQRDNNILQRGIDAVQPAYNTKKYEKDHKYHLR